jgi:hypothetical protein
MLTFSKLRPIPSRWRADDRQWQRRGDRTPMHDAQTSNSPLLGLFFDRRNSLPKQPRDAANVPVAEPLRGCGVVA